MFDITIGAYKFRGYIIVFILAAAWVLFGHLFCSCSNVSDWREGFDIAVGTDLKQKKRQYNATNAKASGTAPTSTGGAVDTSDEASTSATATTTEGFSTNGNQPLPGPNNAAFHPAFAPVGAPLSTPDLFTHMKFGYECCPNTFSNSQGCACMAPETAQFIKTRGNHPPFTEY